MTHAHVCRSALWPCLLFVSSRIVKTRLPTVAQLSATQAHDFLCSGAYMLTTVIMTLLVTFDSNRIHENIDRLVLVVAVIALLEIVSLSGILSLSSLSSPSSQMSAITISIHEKRTKPC